ncbi:MAG TPA: hypothetical protein QGG30_07460, partial [Acidobacteriota bacterium]|nr:hypothetical protein [Acidobacteriota bacterium]
RVDCARKVELVETVTATYYEITVSDVTTVSLPRCLFDSFCMTWEARRVVGEGGSAEQNPEPGDYQKRLGPPYLHSAVSPIDDD